MNEPFPQTRQHWSGERIRKLRQELGLTQLQLANVLRMSKGAIVGWECGYAGPPIGPATVVLDLLQRHVAIMELLATSGPRPKRGRPRKSS